MPKRVKHRPVRPVPVQLPLFAEAASLARIRPERNEWRFYRMEVWPDLFGRALLLRHRAPPSTPWHGWRTRSAAAATRTAPHDHGARKYLTAGEREAFLRAAERADRETRTLCMTLAYGGCRLSEALALTADRVDSTWCRSGWATPSSPRRRSMPTPSVRRSRASRPGCGETVFRSSAT
jgi:integrase